MTRDAAFAVEADNASHVATIRLTNPADGNRLTGDDIVALGRAIREAGSDEAIKIVVIRAEGEHFCLGRIPNPKGASLPSALQIQKTVTDPILGLYADVRATPVPVLAVVQGEARGFGCAFTGQCDLAIASRRATFSMPEMEVNLPPTLAISAVLHKVPLKKLTHMVYTRESITAEEALTFGLVGELADPGDLDAAASRIIAGLTDRRRAALRTIKQYLGAAPYIDPNAAARLAEAMLAGILSSSDEA
ncbi:enoyl-CoA hydratase/carnithine racemase [Rhodoligotrophos appendicifer]|uniref:enoyl-CoA hydratase/isomerase family protein n=1 Tax=Rhodoligotrophos appendicifer TaxID=987056 RepID=UPI001180FC8A|nr:enoyl-CoA hydratase/isomerase family protein [Rhodoligotrophos appendicifer]